MNRILGALALISMALILMWVLGLMRAHGQEPERVWLALCIDASSSVKDESYRLQRDGYVAVLSDPTVANAFEDMLFIWAAEFSTVNRILFEWTPIAEAGNAMALASERKHSGQTGVHACLEAALKALRDKDGRLLIDVSLDGKENRYHKRFDQAVALADERGVTINALALPTREARFEEWVSDRLIIGSRSFYLSVENWDQFASAFRTKLFSEVANSWSSPQ